MVSESNARTYLQHTFSMHNRISFFDKGKCDSNLTICNSFQCTDNDIMKDGTTLNDAGYEVTTNDTIALVVDAEKEINITNAESDELLYHRINAASGSQMGCK